MRAGWKIAFVLGAWLLTCVAAIAQGTLPPYWGIGNNSTQPSQPGAIPMRISLPGQNFYVNGDSAASHNCNGSTCSAGNDSNDCRTINTPCLTTQHVINLIESSVDQANSQSTITIADFKTTNYAFSCSTPWVGSTLVKVQGNHTTPANTVIRAPTGGNAVLSQDLCIIVLQDLHVADSITNDGSTQLVAGHGLGHIDAFNVTLEGSASGLAASVADDGYIAFGSGVFGCNVTGNYIAFIQVSSGGVWSPGQCTGSAGLTFSAAFAILTNGAIVDGAAQLTSGTPSFIGFSGITGPRCIVQGTFNLSSLNPNSVFPGSSDCVPTNAVGAIGVPSGSGASATYTYGIAGQPLLSGGGGNDTFGPLGVAGGGTGATSAGAPAANNIGALAASNNLSDVASAATSRTNLGLGALATVTPGTGVAAALGNATNATGGPVTATIACQSWTPTDQSGASLAFTSVTAQYCQYGNIVYAYGTLTFPSTSNSSNALISLPVPVPNQAYAAVASGEAGATAAGIAAVFAAVQNSSTAAVYSNSGARVTNATLSLKTLTFMLIYPAS